MTRCEVQYRRLVEDAEADNLDAWRTLDDQPASDAGSVTIEGLDLGVRYELRIRHVDDETGATSDWFTWPAVEVLRDDHVPPPVASLRLTKADCLTWEMEYEVRDLQGFLVRHAPGQHALGWDTMERAHEGYVTCAPFLLCRVPKGRRTFAVRPVDWDGNEGEPVYLLTDRGPVDDRGEFLVRVVDQVQEQFGGGLVRGAAAPAPSLVAQLVTGSWLAPAIEPATSIDPATPIPTDPDAVAIGEMWGAAAPAIALDPGLPFDVLYEWIEYVWSFTVHAGEEGPRAVLSVDVGVSSVAHGFEMPWRLEYRHRCDAVAIPLDPFSVAIPVDPGAVAIPDPPARPWRPWPGRLLGLSIGTYEFRLRVPGGHLQARVDRLSVAVSSEARVEHVVGLEMPALGGTRATPLAGDWRHVAEVRAIPVSVLEPTDAVVTDKARGRGPRLLAFQGGEHAAPVLDVVVRGY